MARNYDYNGDPCGEYGAAVRVVGQLREELARLRLTDEEREAVEWATFEFDGVRPDNAGLSQLAAVLRALLERTK
jgi:hypothetical protein